MVCFLINKSISIFNLRPNCFIKKSWIMCRIRKLLINLSSRNLFYGPIVKKRLHTEINLLLHRANQRRQHETNATNLSKAETYSSIFFTYFSTQCAAVRIHWLVNIVPPQKNKDVPLQSNRAAWKGYKCGVTSTPPIILGDSPGRLSMGCEKY